MNTCTDCQLPIAPTHGLRCQCEHSPIELHARIAKLKARVKELEEITTGALKQAPVGNLTAHTVENIPLIIRDYVQEATRLDLENERLEARVAELEAEKAATIKYMQLIGLDAEGFTKQERDNQRLRRALAFASSVIKSGEPWTDTCEEEIGGALAATEAKPGDKT